MLAKTPLRDMMIAWLEQQNPREYYPWDNPFTCACAEFARTLTIERASEWFMGVTGIQRSPLGVMELTGRLPGEWAALNKAARGPKRPRSQDWTYGALLKRLRRAQ